MIPAFLAGIAPRLTLGAIVLALAAGGVWYYGHTRYNAGEAKVQAKWDKEHAADLAAYDARLTENVKVEEERDQLKWRIERELQPKLLAATARGALLAQRLREHYSGVPSGPVPESPIPTADPFGTGGDGVSPREADDLFGAVISACQRDAVRLNGWIEWWEEVSKE